MMQYFPLTSYLHPYLLQLLIAELMFFVYVKRRTFFILRFSLCVPAYLVAGVILLLLIYPFASGFLSMALFLLSLAIFPVCFKTSFIDILFCAVAGLIVQNITYNLSVVFCAPLGDVTSFAPATFAIQAATYIACYTAAYFLCARRLKKVKAIAVGRMITLAIAIVCNIIVYTFQYLLSLQDITLVTEIICRIPFICCNIVVLVLMFGMMERSKLKEEKTVLEQLLVKNAKQYELSKNNIEMINMKCHDLKNQISVLRTEGNKDYLDDIERDIMLYDHLAKTGNTALDVVLSEKSFLCEKHKISFTYMVDGKCLDFIDPVDVATLFGNALDNSIEYLSDISDEKKRVISLVVFGKNNLTSIHIENYYEDSVDLSSGLPKTTKDDKESHGFGLKSIEYIVKKYGGNFVLNTGHNLFSLDIMIFKNE